MLTPLDPTTHAQLRHRERPVFNPGDRVRMTAARVARFYPSERRMWTDAIGTVRPSGGKYLTVTFDGFGHDSYVLPSSLEIAPSPLPAFAPASSPRAAATPAPDAPELSCGHQSSPVTPQADSSPAAAGRGVSHGRY